MWSRRLGFHKNNDQHIQACLPNPSADYMDHWLLLTSLDQMKRTYFKVSIVGTGAEEMPSSGDYVTIGEKLENLSSRSNGETCCC